MEDGFLTMAKQLSKKNQNELRQRVFNFLEDNPNEKSYSLERESFFVYGERWGTSIRIVDLRIQETRFFET
jgi:hypothetical protein